MFAAIDLTIDESVTGQLEAARAALTNMRKPLSILRRGLEHRMNDQLFQTRVGSGGTVRGVNWNEMATYYTRRDGTKVPAWGGIPKVRGDGLVLGRKRKGSAGRVTQDKRFLEPWTGRSVFRYVSMAPNHMKIGSSKQKHIAAFNARRQFLFWNDADTSELPKILQVWIDRHLERAKHGRAK